MEIAPEAVEAPDAAAQRRIRATDNPIVRAVARIPLPLGGKLLIGFALVAGLLALTAVLGLVALSQSNSRGEQLKRLQQTAAYAQLLAADANQLNALVGQRGGGGTEGRSGSTGNGGGAGTTYEEALDNDVFSSLQQFDQDVQLPIISASAAGKRNAGPHFVKKLQTTLSAFHDAWGQVVLSDSPGGNPGDFGRNYQKAAQLTSSSSPRHSSTTPSELIRGRAARASRRRGATSVAP